MAGPWPFLLDFSTLSKTGNMISLAIWRNSKIRMMSDKNKQAARAVLRE